MALADHPRLLEYAKWANDTLPQVKTAFENAKRQRDCAVDKAKSLMKAGDFAAAIPVLEAIVMPLQTPESTELVEQARAAVAEIASLRNEVRSRLASKALDGLKPKVARLIVLQPNDAQFPKLLQQLADWEVRQQKEREARDLRQQQEQQARELRQQEQLWQAALAANSLDGYHEYLKAYPSGMYVEQSRRALAPLLRKKLLRQMENVGVRREYLDMRTPALAKLDEEMALQSCRIAYSVAGGIGGALAGAFIGGVAGWLGGLLAGVVVGIAVAVFLDR